MKMDAVKFDPNAIDLEAEIAKTTELIQILLKSEESIDLRRNLILEKRNRIHEKIKRNQDQELQRVIDCLRIQIVSLDQFPHQPAYFCCTQRIETTTNLTPSLTTKEQSEEMRKLNFQFQHNIKNLAAEREIARELRQCERTSVQQPDHTEEAGMDTNQYCIPLRNRRWTRGLKPLPTEDIKTLIKIWAEKIVDASNRVLYDSKSSTVTAWQHIYQPVDFGKQLYWQVGVGRLEFKRHWDSMRDVKRTIAQVEFGLNKARKRHERGYAKVERLRGKLVEMDEHTKEIMEELRIVRRDKSTASKYLLELTRQ